MYNVMLLILTLSSCSNIKFDTRYFQFNYEVEVESTDGKKLELWIPVPQSNEVQTISNLSFNVPEGLDFDLKTESEHNNKYIYIFK